MLTWINHQLRRKLAARFTNLTLSNKYFMFALISSYFISNSEDLPKDCETTMSIVHRVHAIVYQPLWNWCQQNEYGLSITWQCKLELWRADENSSLIFGFLLVFQREDGICDSINSRSLLSNTCLWPHCATYILPSTSMSSCASIITFCILSFPTCSLVKPLLRMALRATSVMRVPPRPVPCIRWSKG